MFTSEFLFGSKPKFRKTCTKKSLFHKCKKIAFMLCDKFYFVFLFTIMLVIGINRDHTRI